MKMMENRVITMDKIFNMRDLGGLVTQDNHVVKSGLIYRSSRLNMASTDDIKKLQDLKIGRIFDYRSYDEALQDPDPNIENITTYIIPALDFDPVDSDTANIQKYLQAQGAQALKNFYDMGMKMYSSLPFDNLSYKMVFDALKEKKPIPFLHHCTAGRDRTGLASALILKLLGVSDEIIMDDYLLSNKLLVNFYDVMLSSYIKDENLIKEVTHAIELKPDYLNAAFKSIEAKYQNFDEYFLQEYGIDSKIKKQILDNYLQAK